MKIWNLRHNCSKMMHLVREILDIMNACEMFTILANLFYKCYKCLRILWFCCEWNENAKHGYLICILHIMGVSLCLISARPCPVSIFSFKFRLIVHICPAFCGNVNTNASESLQTSCDHLQTSYDHYKCLAINKNGLRLFANMLQICFCYEF